MIRAATRLTVGRVEGSGWSAREEKDLWGSGGGQKLAHSRKSDHTIAFSTARAAGWGLRLRP